jgi:hypothetical protein
MQPGELSKQEYGQTFSPRMLEVTESTEEVVDLWEYAEPVIEALYHSCEAWDWRVEHVYEARDGSFQHIYVPVPQDDTYLLVIVNKPKRSIVGHYILDLR